MASAKRSLDGKNDSRSITPTLVIGGVCTAEIRLARSRSRPAFHDSANSVETRMCSRLRSGSASTPASVSTLLADVVT